MPTSSEPISTLIPGLDAYSIHINDFSLWYGDFQALFNLNVNIKQGIITSMIGPSGCGKTTLLRSVNRINDISSAPPGAKAIKAGRATVWVA